MNKKLLIVAISAALAAPMAASADVKSFGDVRVRYTSSTEDSDFYADKMKDDQTNSRVRWGVQAESDDGVMVKARIKATNGTHGDNVSSIKSDYGYMSVPLGPVTVAGGLMVGNFGNRMTYWDTRPNRVAFSSKFGDWKGVLTFDKMVEAGEADEKDTSSTKIILNGKIPTGKAGLMLNQVKKGKTAAGANPDTSGSETILYYTGQLGPVMVLAEYNTRGGDFYKTVDVLDSTKDQQPNALYLHGIMNVGQFNLQAAYAATKSFKADDHFAPFSTVGTSQDTALMDLGGVPADLATAMDAALIAAAVPGYVAGSINSSMKMWSTTTMALFAGTDVMPKLHVQLAYAQHKAKIVESADDGTASIVDLQATYKVNKATKILGTYGTVSGDTDFAKYKATMMGVSMYTKF